MALVSKFEHAIVNPISDLQKELDRKFNRLEKIVKKDRWLGHHKTRKYRK